MTRSTRSRWTTTLCGLGVVALIGTSLVPLAPAVATPLGQAALTPPVCQSYFDTDFDGDQLLDVAIGIPSEDRGSVAGAGAVEVRHPCSKQAGQFLALPKAHAHDGFGFALAAGRLNGDRYLDLAVGVPGLDVGGRRDAGGVAIFYGSAQGLRYGRTLTQASANVAGSVQAGARFGQTLSTSGWVDSGLVTLRIGEPGRTVDGQARAGGVVDHSLSAGVYEPRGSGEITLATKGVPGDPQAGDAMGSSLYAYDRVGIPNRPVNGAERAGAVLTTPYAHDGVYTLLTQASPDVPGDPETGARFGASLAGSWIGAPGASVDGMAGAGVVIRPSSDPEQRFLLDQHDADPTQVVEAGDHFGAAITELGSLLSEEDWWPQQLLVGAPGEDVDGRTNAGTVSVLAASDNPEEVVFTIGPSYGELQPATVVTGARFGAVLSRVGLGMAQVGAPSARGGRLSLYVGATRFRGPPTLSATLAQVAGTPERGDRYGDAVVFSSTGH
jgi:hypothetical protein